MIHHKTILSLSSNVSHDFKLPGACEPVGLWIFTFGKTQKHRAQLVQMDKRHQSKFEGREQQNKSWWMRTEEAEMSETPHSQRPESSIRVAQDRTDVMRDTSRRLTSLHMRSWGSFSTHRTKSSCQDLLIQKLNCRFCTFSILVSIF